MVVVHHLQVYHNLKFCRGLAIREMAAHLSLMGDLVVCGYYPPRESR